MHVILKQSQVNLVLVLMIISKLIDIECIILILPPKTQVHLKY